MSPVIPPGLEIVKPTRLGAGNELLHLVDAAASGGPPLMIFHVDIDHFASINENMSGEVGDQALTLAARRLQEFLGTRGKLWRHGSDEMVVVAVRRDDTPLPEDLPRKSASNWNCRCRCCRIPCS